MDTLYGYPNHETRSLAIHLDNDEGLYHLVKELKLSSKNWIELSDSLKDYFKEEQARCLKQPTPEAVAFFFDIGSFSDIDFDYLAKRALNAD